MKKLFMVWVSRIVFSLTIVGLSFSPISCGDDEVDCDAVVEELEEVQEDYYDALYNCDCNDIEDAYDEAVKFFTKGKSCDDVKEIMEDYNGADSLDEFLEDLEDEVENNLDYCGC